jgi:hypothetical protein
VPYPRSTKGHGRLRDRFSGTHCPAAHSDRNLMLQPVGADVWRVWRRNGRRDGQASHLKGMRQPQSTNRSASAPARHRLRRCNGRATPRCRLEGEPAVSRADGYHEAARHSLASRPRERFPHLLIPNSKSQIGCVFNKGESHPTHPAEPLLAGRLDICYIMRVRA